MYKNIKKICVMADVTRCKNGTDGILCWLGGLMEGVISRICDIPFCPFSKEELKDLHLSLYGAYGIDLSNNNLKYDFLSVPVEDWLTISFAEPNQKVLEIVKKYFSNTLVISREPALILKKSFEILNIPYVDLAIHSVRYLDDLIMGATTNVPEIYQKLLEYELSEEEFYFHADVLKAEARFKKGIINLDYNANYALFLAQTPVDRSLLDLKNNKLVTFLDYKKEFEKLTQEHDIVFYKSHPFYKNKEVIDYIKTFDNVEICENENIYNLLSLPQFKTCATISSGSANEAKYFGKKVICFHEQPYKYSEEYPNKNDLNKDIHVTIGKNWLKANFWAEILSPIIQTKKVTDIDIKNVHNKLRRILNTSWGYIDCDSTWVKKNINNNINNNIKSFGYGIKKRFCLFDAIEIFKTVKSGRKKKYYIFGILIFSKRIS